MGTSCAPLVADLFLFCYERDSMLSLSDDIQSGAFFTKITRTTNRAIVVRLVVRQSHDSATIIS